MSTLPSSFAARIELARQNYHTKLLKVPNGVIRKPSLELLLYVQHRTMIANAPPDLQLPFVLKRYNEIAGYGYVAQQENQPVDIARAIWYYGIDDGRSFYRYHRQTRYNLIVMAFVWATNFDEVYCDPDTKTFVQAFIDVWIEGMTENKLDVKENDFSKREKFIHVWRDCPFDLTYLTRRHEERLRKLVDQMMDSQLPQTLLNKIKSEPEYIVAKCRSGDITKEEFEKFGPVLALVWVMAYEKNFLAGRAAGDRLNGMRDIEAIQQAWMRIGAGPNPLSHIDWNSELLNSLLEPIDPSLPQPLAKRDRPPSQRQDWMPVKDLENILRGAVNGDFQDELEKMVEMIGALDVSEQCGEGECKMEE